VTTLDSDGFDRYALFRRVVHLEQVPTRVPARVVADSRYVLWINGVEASRGPVRSNPRRLRYDVVDLAPLLHAGKNALAVLVRFYGHAVAWWMPAPPTFTLGAGSLAFEARVDDEWIVTDVHWRALAGGAWTPMQTLGIGGSLPEVHDARRLPADWRAVTFDDSSWPHALALAAVHTGATGRHEPPSPPYGALRLRPVPPLDGERRVAALVDARRVDGPRAQLDPVEQVDADERSAEPGDVELLSFAFGEVVAGIARFSIDAPAGTTFDVSFAEAFDDDGRLARLGQHTGFRYIARGRDDTFEAFDPIGARVARIAVRRPHDQPSASAAVKELSVHERLRPRPAGPWFECSDPLLNRIYEIGLRTVDLCAHDAYVDCPTREQRAWTGDAVVHQMVDLATNPDWSLARWHPELAASPRADGMLPMAAACDFEWSDQTIIPDWALHWVRMVHNLFRYTGDEALVGSLLPAAEGALRWFTPCLSDDGLIHDVPGWVLIDWSSVYVAGVSSALNALWARALRDYAEVAEWLGDRGRATWAMRHWSRVRDSFDRFWDDRRGAYVDHVVDGVPQRTVSQHGGATAICAGLVPEARIERVLASILDRDRLLRHSWVMDQVVPGRDDSAGFALLATGYPPPTWDVEQQVIEAQPFFRYVVHDAVAEGGRCELVGGMCRDWSIFIDRGETTWPETWTGGTHCHGWSSTPTRDLVVHTLGITPAEPGFARVRVAPRLGDLDWIAGAAPSPSGLVTVRADRDHVEIDSPVPAVLDLGKEPPRTFAPGQHRVARS
jgi:hypothetical protein